MELTDKDRVLVLRCADDTPDLPKNESYDRVVRNQTIQDSEGDDMLLSPFNRGKADSQPTTKLEESRQLFQEALQASHSSTDSSSESTISSDPSPTKPNSASANQDHSDDQDD